MTESSEPYRAKIRQRAIDTAPPEHAMPEQISAPATEQPPARPRLSLFTLTCLSGLAALICFMLADAGHSLMLWYDRAPWLAVVLGSLLVVFAGCLVWLVGREVHGYRAVKKYLVRLPDMNTVRQAEHAEALRLLTRHGKQFSDDSFAAQRFVQFGHSVQDDMSGQELAGMYERIVLTPVAARAKEVVRKESLISGSLAFVSPNAMIQTLAILWISLRTVRRVARVYGLRPATAGNWTLLSILAQNLAAQSIFDLASDEIANQVGGSLTSRFVENSAEAVAAGALNVRLGKALIRLLS